MIRALLAVWLLFAVCFFVPTQAFADAAADAWREGEILVQFHEETSPVAMSAAHASAMGQVRREMRHRTQLVALPPHIPVETALTLYRANPRVKHAEPNYIVHRAVTPNDPHLSRQWYLLNEGQRFMGPQRGTAGADIGAPEAWTLHTGSDRVIVAVLDSGVDYLHPDLQGNLLPGWNFVANNDDPMDDDSSHGTHVSGIIGAVGNNGVGVSGVAWAVRILPLKTLGANGNGTLAHAIAAIDHAVAAGARVINASYGRSGSPSTLERQAIERAHNAGVLFVAAAGNAGSNNDTTPFYPASYSVSNIVAVAATDANDRLASFSNYGATSVHLAAPGHLIYNTVRGGGYDYMSGTSMAAPVVSGAAALLMSYSPDLAMSQIRQLLLTSSLSYPALDGKVVHGRLDAGEALALAPSPFPGAPTGVAISSRGADHLELVWETSGGAAPDSFEVQRRAGASGYTPLVTLAAASRSYRDEGASDREGSLYFYRVRAVSAAGASAWSNEAGVSVPPLAPENLQAGIDQEGVLLEWEDHSEVESRYEVERAPDGGSFQKIAELPASSVEHFDATAQKGASYIYRVRAFSDLTGPSDYSEPVAVVLPAPSAGAIDDGDAPGGNGNGSPAPVVGGGGGGGGGGCFIATAAFGSELHPRVATLRQFRDEVLLSSWWGRAFNDLYQRLSPPLARRIEQSETLRSAVRAALTPVFWAVESWMEVREEARISRERPDSLAAAGG